MQYPQPDLPEGFEPRLPNPEECSPGYLLAQRAARAPDEVFAVFGGGESWTNSQALMRCSQVARVLRAQGIGPGARVANWLPNGSASLSVLIATWMLGATVVPINVSARGQPLSRMLDISGAKVLVPHSELVERLADIPTAEIETLIVFGQAEVAPNRFKLVRVDEAIADGPPVEPVLNQPWELAAVIFTSGTTGPSKGVRTTFAQQWTAGRVVYSHCGPNDRMLIHMPLLHIAGMAAFFSAISIGASVAVSEPIPARRLWAEWDRMGCTACATFGSGMYKALVDMPPSGDDKAHGLKFMLTGSMDSGARAFSDRFGVSFYARYQMSEASGITATGLDHPTDRSMGWPRKGIQLRVVDDNDIEVGAGETGECIIRADLPWVLNDGYEKDPAATAAAWRNGWFHTGDLVRRETDGQVYYCGRKKDSLRRRGENISAFEVEAAINEFPDVHESAVIGIGDPSNQDVMAVVRPRQDAVVDPEELMRFLIPRLTYFMIPRYVRFVADFERTYTNKINKAGLRDAGVTSDTWDREATSLEIRRTRLQGT